MQIDTNITNYTVLENKAVIEALQKLNKSGRQILFVVNELNIIKGVFADGDFRRWVTSSETMDLSIEIMEIANTSYISAHENAHEQELADLFSEKINVIPLLDDEQRIVAVATKYNKLFSVGQFNINEKSRALIIAEIGNNHNGSLSEAKKLVDSAINNGADIVKFQMRDVETLYVNQGNSTDLGTQYVLDLLERFQLTDREFEELFAHCKSKNIPILCTPFDIVSADKLEKIGVDAYKVASADLTNHELILHLIKKNKPLIISTGMSTEREIIDTIELLNSNNASYVLLHCNSTYPCPFEDINLNYLYRLKKLSGNVVGYSGHERGISIPLAAVSLGAKIIEKHFTHDKSLEGNDHKVSLLPEEFKIMVDNIREIEISLGNSKTRSISQGEMMNRETLGKSVITTTDIKKGDVILESVLSIKSPGKGLPAYNKNELIGTTAKRDISKNDFFYLSDISHEIIKPRYYKFNNKFGVPVRYHDIDSLQNKSNFDFVEFHLSYKDLDVNIDEIFNDKSYDMDCLVHCPELFSGDHILDLCSDDKNYLERSIFEMQKVIHIARKLKTHFNNKHKDVLIVTNVGGFSKSSFLSKEEREYKLSILKNSLQKLDMTGIELIPQTMPPYPWHFGGQQFHNLFVNIEEIVEWCEDNKMRICHDVSHTALACNYFDTDLIEATKKLAKYTAHLHVADASGTKQEGLQIGEGDIDFSKIFSIMANEMPDAYWLPEVWQGHKNNGEGFWLALDRLEEASMI